MSKIFDALNKIQGANQSREKDAGAGSDSSDTAVIARLVDRASDAGDSVVSNNRMLHLDQEALRDAGLIAPEYHAELLANQYRDIKRPLIAHAFGKRATRVENGNLIMVTSAVAGEGKTFTSINLALSMSQERDHSVLLVDADVAKPHISLMFAAENEPGLLDVLENGDIDLRSVILPTDKPGLSVLPAGRPRANASELLASDAMEDVVSELTSSTTRRIVILDSPPLLQTSEAKVLARLSGQIAMVVRAEHTPRDVVENALATIDDEQAVNLILNQARYASHKYQFAYGYGYGHDKGESTKAIDSEEKAETDLFN
jgi:exopolysaccharide/PEP-CTERM locus tyrosine autokinase